MSADIKLPKDWKWVKLGDVCEKMSNGANAKQSDEKIGLPISRIETIWNETIDLDRVKYIAENDKDFVEKYALKKNDILFSHINSDIHLGKTAIYKGIPKTLIHGINLLLIRLNKEASPDFFNYQLKHKRKKGEFINIAQKSVNQSSINQPKLKNLDFVLPPLSTQQSIVSKIEELFSELDNGIANLKTAQLQLKTYRQSVLKWTFEGKLTNKKVKEGELPKGWKEVNFGELFSESPQNGLYKPSTEYGSGTPIIRIDSFYDGIVLSDHEYKKVKLTKDEIIRYQINIGDILINRVNSMPYLGKCGIVKHLKEKTVFESNIMKISVDKVIVFPEYLSMYLSSKKGLSELRKNAKQAVNQASINQTDVSNVLVPLPKIDEQKQIVQEIESRLSVADKMEESITQSLQQAEALRQSILKNAFEGKLI
ncbi:MAG: restriction endonuclease subunit S [Bacteroidia bacterium]|nr:restriction endonuclease subunit S [Bacteroidia bacterium]